MPVGDRYQVTFQSQIAGQNTFNVAQVRQEDEVDPDNITQDIFDAMNVGGGVIDSWAARSSDEAILSCIKIRSATAAGEPDAIFFPQRNGDIGAAFVLPSNLATLHSWQQNPNTRVSRGRKFWAGIPTLHSKQGKITTDGWTQEVSFASQFQAPLQATNEYVWGVFSTVASAFFPVVVVQPSPIIRVVRSRLTELCG